MKHTEGEWNISKRTNDLEVTISTKSKRICEVKSYTLDSFNDPSTKEANANAKLISAAPELLESLIAIQNRLEYLHQTGRVNVNEAETLRDINIADKAIKKATE